jgi:hypothetical protein
MAGDNGAEQASRRSQEMAEEAVAVLEQARVKYEGDPMFDTMAELIGQIVNNPRTLGPETVDRMKQSARSTATDVADNRLNESREQLSAGAGMRSGAARESEREIAVGLGEQLAMMDREIETQAAMTRISDLMNAVNAAQMLLNQKTLWDEKISNANLGSGNLMLGNANMLYNQQNIMNQAIGGGIGSLLGTVTGSDWFGSALGFGGGEEKVT